MATTGEKLPLLPDNELQHCEDRRARQYERNLFWGRLLCGIFLVLMPIGFVIYMALGYDMPLKSDQNGSCLKKEWRACGTNIYCCDLEVPYDHLSKFKGGNASISVARYSHPTSTKRGMVFLNPGGPGGSGVNFVYRVAGNISKIFNDEYDVVSWDPRGINGTTPRVECFNSQTAQDLFGHNVRTPNPPSNWSDATQVATYTAQLTELDALDATAAALCIEKSGDTLRHVGTATVVRDLEFLSTTLQGKEVPINYWGFSYGTAVGSYFVNMFPNRVGRVVIDGNVDPVQWANERSIHWYKDDLRDSEKALADFYETCSKAGPDRCPLAAHGSTAKALSEAVDKLLADLSARPMPVLHANRAGILTAMAIKSRMFSCMYAPRLWPDLASSLSAAIRGDGVPMLNTVQRIPELDSTIRAETAFANPAVECSDAPPYSEDEMNDPKKLRGEVDLMVEEARLASEVARHFSGLNKPVCHLWTSSQPVERFVGPFNHTLSNTILVVGNTADPICPLHNSRRTSSLLGSSSRLLIQDTSGHCSLAVASLCTAKTIRSYFLEGVVPEDGRVCTASEDYFPPKGVRTWLKQSDQMGVMSLQDVDLLEAVRNLGIGAQGYISRGVPRGERTECQIDF